METMLKKIANYDVMALAAKMPVINSRDSRSLFFALMALNVVAYFVFIAHHLLHNHGFRMPWIPPNDAINHGRWMNFFYLKLTSAADMPVLLALMAIALCVSAALMTLDIWRLRLNSVERFLIAGMITVFPFYLAYYYYTWITFLFMAGTFFAALSLYVCRTLNIRSVVLGALFVLVMMASYQPSLSIFSTIFVGALIADLAAPTNERPLIEVLKSAGARFLAAIIGGVGYILSIIVTKANSHATQTIELTDLAPRLLDVAQRSVKHLYLSQPDLLAPMKIALLGLFALGVLSSLVLARRSPVRALLILICWLGLVLATKTMFLISADNNFWQYRYNASLGFFHAFTAAIFLSATAPKLLRSIAIIGVAFFPFKFVQSDLIRQEVMYRGEQHDMALTNRILARIESLPQLDPKKRYDLVRIGSLPDFRNRIQGSRGHTWDVAASTHMDQAQLSARWADESIFVLLGSPVKFKFSGFDPGFREKEKRIRESLLEGRKPWPDQSAVFITDQDEIVIFFN